MSPYNNTIKLIDAICVAYDSVGYAPVIENGVAKITYCNLFVNDVAVAMGCNDFHDPLTGLAKTADDIVSIMALSQDWQEIRCAGLSTEQMEVALASIQAWANSGYLTIAGANSLNLGSDHGHVCVIRPGLMKSSGKWGEVPCVANIGRENFIGRGKSGPMKGIPVGVNEAFEKIPRYFSWKGI